MKRYTAILLLAGALAAGGCKKYLEQVPDQRTELDSPEKVSELLVNAYPKSNYALWSESMSDNVGDNPASTAYTLNTDAYFWRDNDETGQDATAYYWNGCYKAIAAANQALEAIGLAANPGSYTTQKGEALVCRAYAHFMLVTLFAKPYSETTSTSDKGIPYVTVPEKVVNGSYERKTVAYVYEQIEKDLLEGMPLIADNYTVPRFHFTKRAANAFATRFYLYKKQYDKAVSYATTTFPSGNFAANMRPWLGDYAGLSSTELASAYIKSSENANLLLGETVSWWARRFTAERYSTSSDLMNRILFRSVYANITGGTTAYNYWYNSTSQVYYIRKTVENFVRTSLNATTGVGYVMVPLFTTEEVLLNRAEAYASQDKYTEALADINLFLSQRIKSYVTATHTVTEAKVKTFYNTDDVKAGIIKLILDFKRAEYLHEGMRWFDIIRHDLPVVHTTDAGASFTLAPGDPRRQWQIPQEAAQMIGANPR